MSRTEYRWLFTCILLIGLGALTIALGSPKDGYTVIVLGVIALVMLIITRGVERDR